MSSTPVLPVGVENKPVTIVAADTSSLKTILTAGDVFWDVVALTVTSDDTSNRILSFYVTIGGTDYLIGSVVVPLAAGTDGVVAVKDVIGDSGWKYFVYDPNGNKMLRLIAGALLKVKSTTTLTAAKTVTVVAMVVKS